MEKLAGIYIKKNKLLIVCFTIAFCSLFVSKLVLAEQYQLKLMVDFSQFDSVTDDVVWLDPLNNPIADDEFFVAKNNGLVYLVRKNGINNPDAILDLPQSISHSTFTSLTAISLHPSFALPEEPGYATFYTAHTTELKDKNNNNRLVLMNDTNLNFAFESVVTAWTYDFEKQKIDPLTQREIIRIPINSPETAIQQLAFEPYIKPWNTDYGQLYLSLGFIDELKEEPLYSGAILRIYPLIFGARDYTISETNPFIKEAEINDEIAIFGGQNIEHFFWAKFSHGKIFILNNNEGQHWLSETNVGAKLDSQPQTNLLKQQPNEMQTMLLYQGRNFLELRNRLVFITMLGGQWKLTSQSLESTNLELPISEDIITTDAISQSFHVSIHEDNQNEIIIFDRYRNILYSLQSINPSEISDDDLPLSDSATESNHYVLYIVLITVLLSVLFFIKRKNSARTVAMNILNKEYVRFEYMLTKDAILLFRINSNKPHKTLQLTDITRCEVLLNNNVINIIDFEPVNTMSNQIEGQIRDLFITEQNEKMLEEHTRQIQIILTDKNESYTVCLYLRKGNSRITSEKYYRVVDMVIELCWGISKQLNPQTTETRIMPVVTFTRPNLPVSTKKLAKPQSARLDNDNNASTIKKNSTPTAQEASRQVSQQTELVDALDKLVKLHKQGYLSDEEFSLAKSNLLR